jgi:hypothetical protein
MIFPHCSTGKKGKQENSSIFFDFFSGYEITVYGILRGQSERRGKGVQNRKIDDYFYIVSESAGDPCLWAGIGGRGTGDRLGIGGSYCDDSSL